MNQLLWMVILVLVFVAGWWVGRYQATAERTSGPGAEMHREAALVSRELGSARLDSTPGSASESLSEELATGSWEALLDRIDVLDRQRRQREADQARMRLLDQVRDWARSGDQSRALDLLLSYVGRNPHDLEARLLHSDVLQMQGRLLDAIDPLLAALQFADEAVSIQRIRDALRLLVNVHESKLAAQQNLPGLIRFFERLSREDPGFDGHRLQLARWLLQAGRFDEAEGVVQVMGLVGVTPEARSDFEAELDLARSGLPVQWEDRAMHVEVSAAGRPLRLLVDTGASTSAISRSAASALGSVSMEQSVQVRTAAGTISAEVYRVRDVQVGQLRLPYLDVLVLEQAPPGADGLLGMDVLARFPGLSGSPGRLGRPAT